MYRKLLGELTQNCQWARLQPPCPEREIEKAEAYIGYLFPEELKALLRQTNGDRWFLLSVQEMMENVRRNRETLSEAFEDAAVFREKVDRFIFFATNGCGDYYGYRVLPDGQADTGAICIWEHETFDCRAVAGDIVQLITRYYHDEI